MKNFPLKMKRKVDLIRLPLFSLFSVSLLYAGTVLSATDGIKSHHVSTPDSSFKMSVIGDVFPIEEESLLKIMLDSVAKVDEKKVKDEMEQKAKEEMRNMPIHLHKSEKDEIVLRDISFRVKEDICYVRFLDKKRVCIANKGEVINPLERYVTDTLFIFFSEDDLDFLHHTYDVFKSVTPDIRLVFVGGDMIGVQKKIHKMGIDEQIFYAYPFSVAKLGVEKYPAIVFFTRFGIVNFIVDSDFKSPDYIEDVFNFFKSRKSFKEKDELLRKLKTILNDVKEDSLYLNKDTPKEYKQ